jgi:cytochrome c5
MRNLSISLAAIAIFSTNTIAFAEPGADTYKQACAACHNSGVLKAPKLGDQKQWAPLIAEGQVILTAHGYVGVRGMPAKGGKPDLSHLIPKCLPPLIKRLRLARKT